ncbi:MAG: hypothetical protein FJ086_00760 [Deltaproteobacteria bacterium]|nr:hypothetical protein [Deltaproteobacteria bacterium]
MSPSRRAPEFHAPLTLAALVLLMVNDHLLKPALHNAVTGKLSVLAGCFLLPLFASAVLAETRGGPVERRVRVGAWATLGLFVPIKLSAGAAGAVARALEVASVPLGLGHQHITADPTDPLALPMVSLAVLYARKANA